MASLISNPTGSDVHVKQELHIPWDVIVRGLKGVAEATKAPDGEAEQIAEANTPAISGAGVQESLRLDHDSNTTLSLHGWYAHIVTCALEPSQHYRTTLALAMAFLCLAGKQTIPVTPADLDFVWSLVRDALTTPSITFTVCRSAQGFLSIPLWSLKKHGDIDELFRLHVWLPDGKRGNPDLSIHSHQAFAQSWTLTGEGRDHSFNVRPADADAQPATHAEYGLSWKDSSGRQTGTYQTRQLSSTVADTGKLVHVTHNTVELHARNASYCVPAGAFHSSEVAPNVLHATLFFFDSHRGFQQIAPVLGPMGGKPHTQQREVVGTTPATLAEIVEWARKYWEGSAWSPEQYKLWNHVVQIPEVTC